ncbi:hypothetical protein DNTS_013093 [Danionella cerebrum]|uniref:Neuromedin U C-terminal domain-containing protein n=1 Tax=Danionella cerebrum TaxID=2873325 RepID=A0A553QY99_9TELE|nr:hypothetical protein DNTS_013093 [Danionella translucida]
MTGSSQCTRAAAHSTTMNPTHSSSLLLAVLLFSSIHISSSAPALLNPSSLEHEQLLTQITELCSFYLSAEPSFRTSNVLDDLCLLMLETVQKPKEITARETSKRSPVFHPLLELIPQLARRRSRRMKVNENLEGTGRIQSRGYFIYRFSTKPCTTEVLTQSQPISDVTPLAPKGS